MVESITSLAEVIKWNHTISLSFEVEMKTPTEGAPVLSFPWWTSVWICIELHHTHCTPREPPQQPILILQEPLRFLWRARGSFKRVFKMRSAQSGSVPCKYFLELRKWSLMENHSAPSAGHINRAERKRADSVSLSLSNQQKNTQPPPSEVWCPFVQEITSKTKKPLRRKKSVRLR